MLSEKWKSLEAGVKFAFQERLFITSFEVIFLGYSIGSLIITNFWLTRVINLFGIVSVIWYFWSAEKLRKRRLELERLEGEKVFCIYRKNCTREIKCHECNYRCPERDGIIVEWIQKGEEEV